MFSEAPELYDEIYGAFKEYAEESKRIATLLRELAPDATSVLDVACGTGSHARDLHRDHGYAVDGIDIEPVFVELARSKVPGRDFWVADMVDFSLGRRYDVILCLFSAIGYVRDLPRVTETLRCFRRHLEPSGVAIVEPWFAPDQWTPGRVYLHTTQGDELSVVRMSHSLQEGHVSVLDFQYLIGRPDGIEHRRERHELGLFTPDEMLGCFEEAGFVDVRHDPEGLIGRGLYVARNDG